PDPKHGIVSNWPGDRLEMFLNDRATRPGARDRGPGTTDCWTGVPSLHASVDDQGCGRPAGRELLDVQAMGAERPRAHDANGRRPPSRPRVGARAPGRAPAA